MYDPESHRSRRGMSLNPFLGGVWERVRGRLRRNDYVIMYDPESHRCRLGMSLNSFLGMIIFRGALGEGKRNDNIISVMHHG